MAFPTLGQIASLRQPTGLENLGKILSSGYQSYLQADNTRQKREAANSSAQKEAQAANFLKQAIQEQDPQKSEAFIMEAFKASPDTVSSFFDIQGKRTQMEGKGSTRYQAVPFETGFRVFDRKTGDFTGELVEDKAAAAKAAVELEEKAAKGKPSIATAKEGQQQAATFARRMFDSTNSLDELEKTIDPTNRVIPIISGGSGIVSELANRAASPEEQQYATAASDFVTAQLRKESGAAIGQDEFDRKYREFFPVSGDTKAQIEAKRKRRRKAAEDMALESGGLYESIYQSKPEKSDAQGGVIIQAHPVYGDITEADIAKTMEAQGMTREQVLKRLEAK